MLRRIREDRAQLLLISCWESWEAIREFAGEDVDNPRHYPSDQAFLLELEPTGTHDEVLAAPRPGDA